MIRATARVAPTFQGFRARNVGATLGRPDLLHLLAQTYILYGHGQLARSIDKN